MSNTFHQEFPMWPSLEQSQGCCAVAELCNFNWPQLTPEKVKKAADLCQYVMNQESDVNAEREAAFADLEFEFGREPTNKEVDEAVKNMVPPYTVVFATLIPEQINKGYEDVLLAAGFKRKWKKVSRSTNNEVSYYMATATKKGF